MAPHIDLAASQRRHHCAKQVDRKQPPERGRAQTIGRALEVEGDVGEHRHLREQHAEAHQVGRHKLRVACNIGQ